MYITEEYAECCIRWYSRTVGRASWTHCFDCKQPLVWKPIGQGKRITKEELREQQFADWRRRRESRAAEKAERRHGRQVAAIHEHFPLFADEFIAALPDSNA